MRGSLLTRRRYSMPAVTIDTKDKDLSLKTFHSLTECGYGFLPERTYIIKECDFEWLKSKKLPIRVMSPEEVKKSVEKFNKKGGKA